MGARGADKDAAAVQVRAVVVEAEINPVPDPVETASAPSVGTKNHTQSVSVAWTASARSAEPK